MDCESLSLGEALVYNLVIFSEHRLQSSCAVVENNPENDQAEALEGHYITN